MALAELLYISDKKLEFETGTSESIVIRRALADLPAKPYKIYRRQFGMASLEEFECHITKEDAVTLISNYTRTSKADAEYALNWLNTP